MSKKTKDKDYTKYSCGLETGRENIKIFVYMNVCKHMWRPFVQIIIYNFALCVQFLLMWPHTGFVVLAPYSI